MKNDFWLERWEKGEIGFHQDEINPYLRQYWQDLHIAQGGRVFVPLCGKSRDMWWLGEHGYPVLGVELSQRAVQAFFEENGYESKHGNRGQFEIWYADDISILRGDFFDLSKSDLDKVAAVYDRASLIALPPEMRERYVRHLADILPPGTKILLITIAYPQDEMQGPPFSVTSSEVESLYGKYAEVRLLSDQDVLAHNLRFQQRGLSQMREKIYMLTLR